MSARSIGSGTITFGLVTIPVKLYTAVSSKQVAFNMLHKTAAAGGPCGSRVKQQLLCGAENVPIERTDTVKGYEHTKDQYVLFTEEEFRALETRSQALEVLEFVSAEAVDLLHVEKSFYLGPDKGGDRAYQLFARAMDEEGVIAIGRFAQRGKDNLVAVRPYKGGLLLHELYYATEVRSFDEVDTGAKLEPKPAELELASQLIARLRSATFDASKYRDEYAVKVEALVKQKLAGEEVVLSPEAPKKNVVDLLAALKASVELSQAKVANANAEVVKRSAKGPKKAEPRKSDAKKKRRSGDTAS